MPHHVHRCRYIYVVWVTFFAVTPVDLFIPDLIELPSRRFGVVLHSYG